MHSSHIQLHTVQDIVTRSVSPTIQYMNTHTQNDTLYSRPYCENGDGIFQGRGGGRTRGRTRLRQEYQSVRIPLFSVGLIIVFFVPCIASCLV